MPATEKASPIFELQTDEVCICEELDDLVLGELEAEEGTRMNISVSVPPSDICSTPEKGQDNYSLFLPPARDSDVIPIGSSHSTAAHKNHKLELLLSLLHMKTIRNLIFQLELLLSLLQMKTRRNLIHQSELLPSLCHIVIHVQRLKRE
ncbi:unnamed protein product [Arabidopsis lyrata]|nr:unnamed protein product [Arabidopsis lyrata]